MSNGPITPCADGKHRIGFRVGRVPKDPTDQPKRAILRVIVGCDRCHATVTSADILLAWKGAMLNVRVVATK